MVAAVGLRQVRKLWILVVGFVTVLSLSYIYAATKHDFNIQNTIAPVYDKVSKLDILGYEIRPQNVRFKFINPKNKSGARAEIIEQNTKTYEDLAKAKIDVPKDFDIDSIRPPEDVSKYKHANATIVSLVRNKELEGISSTIKLFEKQFNSKFRYPYTFMNDEPFTDEFKAEIAKLTDAPTNYVVIPPHLWNRPDSIDKSLELAGHNRLSKLGIPYATKVNYRNMCRFYSGNFYNVPELQKYKYYWRIEPDVKFLTEVKYDVFKYMEGTGKVYGFTMNLYDIEVTVPTLWTETLAYLNTGDNYKYVNPNGAFQWLLDNLQHTEKARVAGGYSCCHFWSNFEIADMDFWRSDAYNNWFKYLDSTGKFYYERWGDAPVHSIGVGLFADKSKVHWFRDIGYTHAPYFHCPNTDTTADCKIGEFCGISNLQDQNCMGNWIDYSMENPDAIY